MKDGALLPWTLLLGVVALLALFFATGGDAHPLEGTEAPTFALPIVAGEGSAEAASFDLSAQRGRVVVVDFWASWCPPCRRSIPILNEIQERYSTAPVTFMGVNVEENLDVARVRRAHAHFDAAFPSVQDRDQSVRANYRIDGLPTLLVIDQAGFVRWVHVGVPSAGDLSDTLDDLLE